MNGSTTTEAEAALVVAKRPDSGDQEGSVIHLLANHFLVKFDKIDHYDVEISQNPSKEIDQDAYNGLGSSAIAALLI